jgi:hypothetical protein
VAKNVGFDRVSGFEENATEVSTAKNRSNGGYWGSVDPKSTKPQTNPNPGELDISALIKLIMEFLGKK